MIDRDTWVLLGIGFGAGSLSGLFGVGGGIVIVPMLVSFLGFSQLKAQGTSLGVLVLPVALLSALRYYRAGNLDMRASLVIALCMALFALLGAHVANHLPQEVMRRVFGALMVGVGVKFIFFP